MGKRVKTDADVIDEEHRFVWKPEDFDDMTWERRQALQYDKRLVKVLRHDGALRYS